MPTIGKLIKYSESDLVAIYSFGPDESNSGKLAISKQTGKCVELNPKKGDQPDEWYILASRRIQKHFASDDFPEESVFLLKNME